MSDSSETIKYCTSPARTRGENIYHVTRFENNLMLIQAVLQRDGKGYKNESYDWKLTIDSVIKIAGCDLGDNCSFLKIFFHRKVIARGRKLSLVVVDVSYCDLKVYELNSNPYAQGGVNSFFPTLK